MVALITVLHVIVCLFLMLTVLLQSGKGGSMGAAFGGGNAATVFGGSGASTFLRRMTAIAATIFMLASMVLAYISSYNSSDPLEKFGKAQSEAAKQKEDAKAKIQSDTSGTGSVAPAAPGAAVDSSAADSSAVDGSATPGAASAQAEPDKQAEEKPSKAETADATKKPEKKIKAEKADTATNSDNESKPEKVNKGNTSVETTDGPSDVPATNEPAGSSPAAPQ